MADDKAKGGIVTYDPTSGPLDRKDTRVFPRRPATLEGAVVGFISNGLGQSHTFMDVLAEELGKLARIKGAVKVRKGGKYAPPGKDDWSRITSEATVAVTGVGG